MVSKELTVSMVVPVYNGGAPFLHCLESLTHLDPKPAEIIIAADGDTDGSREAACAYRFNVLTLPGPGGPARARNWAARHAQGDVILFVDADVTVPVDIVAQVTTIFSNEPSIDAIIGSYDDAPASRKIVSQYRNLLHHYVHQTSSSKASTFWAGCGAIRRHVFHSIGGFDEGYHRPSVEDIELGYRLKREGYRVYLDKRLQVRHLKEWTLFSLLKADIFDRAIPWTQIIWQYRMFVNDLNTSTYGRVSVVAGYVGVGLSLAQLSGRGNSLLLGVVVLILLAVNAPVYRFFIRQRGWMFTVLVAIPLHWLYYLCSGVGFLIGSFRFLYGIPRCVAVPRRSCRLEQDISCPSTKEGSN
jgi:GT2 family glycosyltransferase